ncbi:hypothetical protein GOB94_06320 [Granulicella sp. 5B5]|uniref:hypothetical protein n=1 Tax=Granulicella sp. 5B5 TaxID=1617967 RepID=UPI0015F6C82E|nr:hypothetical protein [Granulicella sp. 5B5]QMV18343.1 hypothetical protein GOB94_06320 [Granulicella sp. 5B5]
MPKLASFSTPAFIQDLAGQPELQDKLNALWNHNVQAFTQQAIFGNPWNTLYASNQTSYYNPTETNMPVGQLASAVPWIPFPNRLMQYCAPGQTPPNPNNLPMDDLYQLADFGSYANGKTPTSFPQIPSVLCPNANWNSPLKAYGPYGPRGWLDEYCEWSVTRNESGKITRIDFVCENPEYWYSLWRVSPSTVAQIYTDTLNYGLPANSPNMVSVQESDLYLYDASNNPVIDPSTGNPAYNPLNRWNTGTISTRGNGVTPTGGAMHLTSTPNTLQTEMGLAGAATVLRKQGNVSSQGLICCSQYGQEYRNSDPTIGQSVNQAVDTSPTQSIVALADPAGLYIQTPDFSVYALPDDPNLPAGATAADCWQIVRGQSTIEDPLNPGTDYPGNFILHVAFQLPAAWIEAGVSFTVGDITIRTPGATSAITYAGQIAQTMHIALFARPIPASQQASAYPCVANPSTNTVQPVQMMYQNLWDAYYQKQFDTPTGVEMSLASNTVIVPMQVKRGQTFTAAIVCLDAAAQGSALPTVSVEGGDFEFTSVSLGTVTYAAPGNSYPSSFLLLSVSGTVSKMAATGLRNIAIANPGEAPGPFAPAMLFVS